MTTPSPSPTATTTVVAAILVAAMLAVVVWPDLRGLERLSLALLVAAGGVFGLLAQRRRSEAVRLREERDSACGGREVGRLIRLDPDHSGVLLVALTGYGQEEDRRRSRQAGFDAHLVKPPAIEDLERLLTHPKLVALAASHRGGMGAPQH